MVRSSVEGEELRVSSKGEIVETVIGAKDFATFEAQPIELFIGI